MKENNSRTQSIDVRRWLYEENKEEYEKYFSRRDGPVFIEIQDYSRQIYFRCGPFRSGGKTVEHYMSIAGFETLFSHWSFQAKRKLGVWDVFWYMFMTDMSNAFLENTDFVYEAIGYIFRAKQRLIMEPEPRPHIRRWNDGSKWHDRKIISPEKSGLYLVKVMSTRGPTTAIIQSAWYNKKHGSWVVSAVERGVANYFITHWTYISESLTEES